MQPWLPLGVALAAVLGLALAFVLARRREVRFWTRALSYVAALKTVDGAHVLDRLVAPLTAGRAGESGLLLVPSNIEALGLRLNSARLAGRSLDLQYYYWKADLTGQMLCREVIAAADRGVRVRLLLDDINAFGFDSTYIALDSHRNISVRMFNPSRSRGNRLRRGIELLLKYSTSTRRMHNKSWIVDGRLAIVGGRNIGDAYFDASEQSNFRDVDVLMMGKAVADTVAVFDSYWNSASAVPIRFLHRHRRPKLAKLTRRLDGAASSPQALRLLGAVAARTPIEEMLAGNPSLKWTAEASVLADPPEKAAGGARENWLAPRIRQLFGGATSSLCIVSPYFVPGVTGARELRALKAQGVDIEVLTNSLAATDVVAVHGAYARYRRLLVDSGIRLFELKQLHGKQRASVLGSRTASLHTKSFVIDAEQGFVGSFNLDPRSASINTEMGVFFRDAELAGALRKLFDKQTASGASYRLEMRGRTLVWHDLSPPPGADLTSEPGSGFWRRLMAWVIGLLPIESQL